MIKKGICTYCNKEKTIIKNDIETKWICNDCLSKIIDEKAEESLKPHVCKVCGRRTFQSDNICSYTCEDKIK